MINDRTLIQTATQSGEQSEPQEMPSPVIWAHFPFLGCQSEAFVTGADGQRQLKMAEFHSLSPLGGGAVFSRQFSAISSYQGRQ